MEGISEGHMAITDSSVQRAREEGIGAMSSCLCFQEACAGGFTHISLQAIELPGLSSCLGNERTDNSGRGCRRYGDGYCN